MRGGKRPSPHILCPFLRRPDSAQEASERIRTEAGRKAVT